MVYDVVILISGTNYVQGTIRSVQITYVPVRLLVLVILPFHLGRYGISTYPEFERYTIEPLLTHTSSMRYTHNP